MSKPEGWGGGRKGGRGGGSRTCDDWDSSAPVSRFSEVDQPSLHTPRGRFLSYSRIKAKGEEAKRGK